LLVLLCLQPILYIVVKHYWFEAFYYSHIVLYIIMTYAAVQHNALLILLSTIIWAVDLIIRYILTSRRVMIHMKSVTSEITMVRIDKKIYHQAGQYVFLMIPSLGVLQWHPYFIFPS